MALLFNDTATTEIYTLSLHDALPIWGKLRRSASCFRRAPCAISSSGAVGWTATRRRSPDRQSTRLNSSHANISYAVFCLKKKPCLLTPPSVFLFHPSSSPTISPTCDL